MEIPVYLFTGFLESGKTTFIQEALEADDFNSGEKTLLLLCEEGEVELEQENFAERNIFLEVIENEEDINTENLAALLKKHNCERVVVEYNGMWLLDTLYENMPEEWISYQEMLFIYSPTFLTYNQNMRNLIYDKLKSAEIVVCNRFSKDYDKMEFHKIIRAVSKRCQIIYEYEKDNVEFDDIEDPLPFDIDAPVVVIKDEDYATWYRDINDEPEKYIGKTLTVKARTLTEKIDDDNEIVLGRHIMSCCVDDIQFGGLVGNYGEREKLVHGDWAVVTAEVVLAYSSMYQEEGPVLKVKELEVCKPAEPEVATFY